MTDVDVLVIGAGVSGIGIAVHVQHDHPDRTVAILERRERIGGTWDLFRYPGIRSDSDVTTFGYDFRPWNSPTFLADGPAIRTYVTETAAEHGVADLVHFGVQVRRASWCSEAQHWTVEALDRASGEVRSWTCRFLVSATGYYDHDAGHEPTWPGQEDFAGRVVHPQFWPEDLDLAGKQVVVVGSGATAVTIVPAVADTAAHVTMLQRSPTWLFPMPNTEHLGLLLERFLPSTWVHRVVRARNLALQRVSYLAARRFPKAARRILLWLTRRLLDGAVDVAHFTPTYDPWEERLCIVPDGDLFRVLRDGSASVVTDTIAGFTQDGVRLSSGGHLDADVVVTATGLNLQTLGGIALEVDGETVDPGQRLFYRGVLFEGVPNHAWVFGYVNASWTLKADLTGHYLRRLLDHMDTHGLTTVTAVDDGDHATDDSVMDALQSGYVRRGGHALPRQGTEGVWHVTHHYGRDRTSLLHDPIDDPALRFGRASADARLPTAAVAAP